MKTILIVMRDAAVAEDIRAILSRAGNRVSVLADEASGRQALSESVPDALVLGADFGQNYVAELHKLAPRMSIVCWLNEYNARMAVDMMKHGAFDCLTPPLRVMEVIATVSHAMEAEQLSLKHLLPVYWAFNRTRKIIIGILAVIALFIGVRAFQYYRVPVELRLPYQDPTSVVSAGQFVWVGNWYTQSIYKYKIQGKTFVLLNTYYFSDFGPLCLAWDGDYLWSVGNDLVLRQHVINEKLEVRQSFRLEYEQEPVGLAVEGQYIYLCDARQKQVFRHMKDDTFALSTSYPFELPNPVGLTWGENGVWIADAETNRICRFENKGSRLVMVSSAKLPYNEFNSVAAFYLDHSELFVAHSGKYARLLRYRSGTLSWRKPEGVHVP